MIQQIYQHLLIVIFFAGYTFITKKKFLAFLYLIGLPFVFYYLVDIRVLLLALLSSTAVFEYTMERKKVFLIIAIFSVLAAFAIFFSSSSVFHPTLDVINSQRGEHLNFEHNLLAKALHNRLYLGFQYLDKLVKQISLSIFFADGRYRDFSNYVPLGYLFPWDLVFVILTIKRLGKKLLNPLLISTLILSLIVISAIDGLLLYFFITFLVFLLALFSVFSILKLPGYLPLLVILLNTLIMCMFTLPVNILWDLKFRP